MQSLRIIRLRLSSRYSCRDHSAVWSPDTSLSKARRANVSIRWFLSECAVCWNARRRKSMLQIEYVNSFHHNYLKLKAKTEENGRLKSRHQPVHPVLSYFFFCKPLIQCLHRRNIIMINAWWSRMHTGRRLQEAAYTVTIIRRSIVWLRIPLTDWRRENTLQQNIILP